MRLGKILLLLFIIPALAYAGNFSCEVTEAIANAATRPELASNADFWKGLAKIQAGNDAAAAEYLKKFGVQALVTARDTATTAARVFKSSATAPTTQSVQFSNRAEKISGSLQPHIKEKINEFVSTISTSGLNGIRNNNHLWALKRLKETGNNSNIYVVRLKGDHRLSFELIGDGTVKILDIGHHVSH